MNHFEYKMVKAGKWSRINEPTPDMLADGRFGQLSEDRPHLMPVTNRGRVLVALDAWGIMGHTGLCPGNVILDDGTMVEGYRFQTPATQQHLEEYTIPELNKAVRQMQEQHNERIRRDVEQTQGGSVCQHPA